MRLTNKESKALSEAIYHKMKANIKLTGEQINKLELKAFKEKLPTVYELLVKYHKFYAKTVESGAAFAEVCKDFSPQVYERSLYGIYCTTISHRLRDEILDNIKKKHHLDVPYINEIEREVVIAGIDTDVKDIMKKVIAKLS